jgi:hypothetical protein
MGAKRENNHLQEPFLLTYDHAQLTATTAVKLFKVPAGRKLRIDAVDYINPTGLAADASNYFALKLLGTDSEPIFVWSTETGSEGTIDANTFVNLVTEGSPVLSEGDILSAVFDETGTATLPAGRLVVRGRWVQ